MTKTPTRPGPAAYVVMRLLYGSAFALFALRVVTYVLSIPLGRTGNFVLITAIVGLLCSGCALRSYLTGRQNRAFQAEMRAEQQAERERLRAEADRMKAELVDLREQVKEIEQQAWWNDPDTAPGPAEDTVDLSNVHWLPPKNFPESRSS